MHVVPEDEDGYPEPRPPTTRKDEIFHVKDYVNVDEQATNTPSELLEDFDFLLEHLMRDLETPLDMVRSIYMWVTSQKIPMMSAVGFTSIDTPKGFLFNIRQRKATYPELFAVLCRRAHIPCVIIHGLCKNIAYDAGEKVSYTKGRGSWNAVLVGGHWRLVHPYWGAHAAPGYATGRWGLVDSSSRDKAARIPSIATENTTNEFYFFTDPDQFLKKCLPENQEWQLVPHPISKTDFEELPFYQPAYFDLKLKEVCHESCIVHTENGVCEFQMSMPADRAKRYKFNYKLHARRNIFAEGEYDVMALENYSYHYRFEDKEYFHFRFPYIGVFKLDIFCKDSKRPLPSDWVCQYKIICAETGVNVKPLPVSSEIGWGPTDALVDLGMDSLTHKHPIINLDTEPVTFVRFALPKDRTVEIEADFVTHGMSSDEMSSHVTVEIEGEVVVVQVSPPGEGEYALQLYTRDGEDRTNICNYLMVRTNIVEDPELADIRKELDEAIDDGDVETLAHWIDRFSERGMEDRGDLARAKRKLQLSRLNRDLQEAIKRKDLDLLERALHSASSSSLRRHIGELGTQAEAMRSRLRRFKRLQHEVLAMDQKTISEMRSYPKPPPAVHAVMAATFLMLGIKEADLKKWTKIQGLISKRGKESLKRRVAEFRTDSVPPAVLTRVHEILSKYDLETVQVASVGAATFYQWAFSMATEIGDKDT
ncbi:HIL-like protein [Mya arenaria]|uniref:HIL-like protein n=2 Tax=Mya arenaria TaxID=6604 RepID=A0ABY7DKV0_MYAAR|nr:HIL-like protein [Mya arenaria]